MNKQISIFYLLVILMAAGFVFCSVVSAINYSRAMDWDFNLSANHNALSRSFQCDTDPSIKQSELCTNRASEASLLKSLSDDLRHQNHDYERTIGWFFAATIFLILGSLLWSVGIKRGWQGISSKTAS